MENELAYVIGLGIGLLLGFGLGYVVRNNIEGFRRYRDLMKNQTKK